jgi:hypothetical protein
VTLALHQVNPKDLSNDFDPRFIAEFHKNLKILTQVRKSQAATYSICVGTFH